MSTADTLESGRQAFARRAWTEAHAQLQLADRERPLDPEDLERLATAAYLIGRVAESAEVRARAHQEFLSRANPRRAARCAFWLAFGLLHHGEPVRGRAWIARARGILDEAGDECAERGYLLLPGALESVAAGDIPGAYRMFSQAAEIGRRFSDRNLLMLAQNGRGRVLVRMGKTGEGVGLLDETMVGIEAGDVSPLVVGDVYCSMIEGCLELFDLRRASEWTAALTRWCESQPDLVPFTGQCLVRRAEILQLRGTWAEASADARRACERFGEGPDQPAAGAAFYQRGELHRLQGEFDAAENAYRQASRYGRSPQPGLAQLRLAQGRTEAAAAVIRRALDDAKPRWVRSRLLPAFVEIALAAGDVRGARGAADELAAIADEIDAPLARATATQARGAVLLAEGDAQAALTTLRRAWTIWQEIEVPYEAGRVRVLIGLACRAMGDEDSADMELDAARWIFQQLGAAPDLTRVDRLGQSARAAASGLSARETQVLRLVAAGRSNRAIAAELLISERTVERHVSNIFLKLDVSSRTAATAYAYQHRLV